MKKIVSIALYFIFNQLLHAQNWETKFKELDKKGFPAFYTETFATTANNILVNKKEFAEKVANFNLYSEIIDANLKRFSLPHFLRYISLSSTGCNIAYAKEDARGMWPINYIIGKKYELKLNDFVDERHSVEASSIAACSYLRDLQYIYKDWLKTILAFKLGAIRVNQIIRESGNSLQFADLYNSMKADEREIIDNFYANAYCSVFYKENNFPIFIASVTPKDTASSSVFLPFKTIEEFTGISVVELQLLNPELINNIVPFWQKPYTFFIPANKSLQYALMRDSMIHVVMRKTLPTIVYDTLVRIKDSSETIEIKPRVIEPGESGKPGHRIEIKDTKTVDGKNPNNDNKNPAVAAYSWVYYKVKAGDGFFTLSDIFDCTIPQLKTWNGIRTNKIIAGQLLKFYVASNKLNYYQQINYMNATQKRNIALRD